MILSPDFYLALLLTSCIVYFLHFLKVFLCFYRISRSTTELCSTIPISTKWISYSSSFSSSRQHIISYYANVTLSCVHILFYFISYFWKKKLKRSPIILNGTTLSRTNCSHVYGQEFVCGQLWNPCAHFQKTSNGQNATKICKNEAWIHVKRMKIVVRM